MRHNFTVFVKNFMKCGLAGWCMEITFTALDSLRRRDMTLRGCTSLWMFPIYGCAALLSPLSRILDGKSVRTRGLSYAGLIFTAEYLTGSLLARHRLCPWDYGRSRWNIGRVIRLDYAPCWIFAGLLFERLLSSETGKPPIAVSSRH